MKYNIKVTINNFSNLNFIIDKSFNINYKYITNVSYCTKLNCDIVTFKIEVP